MMRKALMLKLFDAAYMQRWNDKIRPVELRELDKQAHKMLIAFFLGKFEEKTAGFDWIEVIEGGLFELLQRLVITDLKPPMLTEIARTIPGIYGARLTGAGFGGCTHDHPEQRQLAVGWFSARDVDHGRRLDRRGRFGQQ